MRKLDPDSRPHVAISGGGVGGMALALALARAGLRATVFERSDDMPAGGSLWLWSNGMRTLRSLGVADAVLEAGTLIERYEVRTWSGTLIWSAPVEDFSRRFDGPLVVVRRTDLVRALAGTDPALDVRRSTICGGFAELTPGVRPFLFGGSGHGPRGELFDALVGADGVHSIVRRQLLGTAEPPPHAVGWALAGCSELAPDHCPLPPGTGFIFVGDGRVLTGSVPRDRKVNWWASGWGGDQGARRFMETCRQGAHPMIGALYERPASVVRFSIWDRPFAPYWGRGRVTLMGDAAHPMLPSVGQGGGQALEDAVCLARCLEEHRSVETALSLYESRRKERVERICRFSRMVAASLMGTPSFARPWLTRLGTPMVMNAWEGILGGGPVPASLVYSTPRSTRRAWS